MDADHFVQNFLSICMKLVGQHLDIQLHVHNLDVWQSRQLQPGLHLKWGAVWETRFVSYDLRQTLNNYEYFS